MIASRRRDHLSPAYLCRIRRDFFGILFLPLPFSAGLHRHSHSAFELPSFLSSRHRSRVVHRSETRSPPFYSRISLASGTPLFAASFFVVSPLLLPWPIILPSPSRRNPSHLTSVRYFLFTVLPSFPRKLFAHIASVHLVFSLVLATSYPLSGPIMTVTG